RRRSQRSADPSRPVARRGARRARSAAAADPRRRRGHAAGDRPRRAPAPGPGLGRPGELVVIAPSTLGFVLAVCVLALWFFVAAEVALSACDRNRLRGLADTGDLRARRAERLLAAPQITLATTLVGATLATLIAVLVFAVELDLSGASPLWAPAIVVPPLL